MNDIDVKSRIWPVFVFLGQLANSGRNRDAATNSQMEDPVQVFKPIHPRASVAAAL